jgi:hypothetical protein
MFQSNFVDPNKTQILCSTDFFSKILPFIIFCGKRIASGMAKE